MKKTSILVVDDEPQNFDVIKAFLEDENFILHYASNGLDAVDSLDVSKPDIILLDVLMPGVDGMEVCHRIKSQPAWQGTPIVMMTALAENQDMPRCQDGSADDFIRKPVSQIELLARIRSMLRIKRQYDEIKAHGKIQAGIIQLLQSSLDELYQNWSSSLPKEFGTSLNGVSGIIEALMRQRASMDDQAIQELLTVARQSVTKLEKSFQQFLLDYTVNLDALENDESGDMPTPLSNFNAAPLIEYWAKGKAELANRKADLECDLTESLIKFNPLELQFVVDELLENAFKFSEPGTPVTINCGTTYKWFHITISDQGRGMTAEQIAQIDSFKQFEPEFYEREAFTLGLYIVKKMIATYAGKCSIESDGLQGTTVKISIPSQS